MRRGTRNEAAASTLGPGWGQPMHGAQARAPGSARARHRHTPSKPVAAAAAAPGAAAAARACGGGPAVLEVSGSWKPGRGGTACMTAPAPVKDRRASWSMAPWSVLWASA